MMNSIRNTVVLVAMLVGTMALPVKAGVILLAGDSNIFQTGADNEVFFQNVFNGTSVANYASNSLSGLGTSATETHFGTSTAITSTGLAGKDFMIFGYNRTSVSASELTAISDFHNAGGSLFLFGEGNTGFTALNTAVNSVLSAVSSSMSLSTSTNFDNGGFNTFSVTGSGSYASGVNTWTTAYAAKINLGSGQAVISGTADNGYGVAIAVEGASSVPEPASLALMGLGLLGLGFRRRNAG